MFQSTISVDPDTAGISSPDLEEELHALTFDAASERLRQAYLHNGQVRARALFAAFLGVTAFVGAMIAGWAMYRAVTIEWVVGWVATVAFVNWVSARRAMAAAAWGSSRNARLPAAWLPVAEAVGLAALWASLPAYAFATQGPGIQLVMGGAMAGMTVAAIAFVAMPSAAIAWIATLTCAFCVAYYLGGAALDPRIGLTYLLIAGAGAFSVTRLTRWIFGQMEFDRARPDPGRIDPSAAERI